MVLSLVCALFLTSTPNDKGYRIMSEMLGALKDVHSVELRIEGEDIVKRTPLRASVRAAANPIRYWAELRDEGRGVTEYAAYSDGKMLYSDDAGKRVSADVPNHTAAVNLASTFAYYGWQTFLDPERPARVTTDTCFFVHEEEVEGHPCDLVGFITSLGEEETRTSIRYFWIDKQSHLPRAFQLHGILRGTSQMGPKWRFFDIVLNPAWTGDPFRDVPERIEATPAQEKTTGVSEREWKAGDPCPDLEVQSLEMRSIRLPELLKGRTLVTFWAPWCGPCLAEMQALPDLPQIDRGEIHVVAIGVFDSKENVRRYARENKRPFTYAIDPECELKESMLAKTFGLSGIPHAFLFDETGKLVRHWVGFRDKEELLRQLGGK